MGEQEICNLLLSQTIERQVGPERILLLKRAHSECTSSGSHARKAAQAKQQHMLKERLVPMYNTDLIEGLALEPHSCQASQPQPVPSMIVLGS